MSAKRNWIDPDLSMPAADYRLLIDLALQFKLLPLQEKRECLRDRAVYFMFFNQSLRTRSSFQTGLAKMGGHAIPLDPGTGIYTPAMPGCEVPYHTERVSDVARVLSEFGDAVAIRMYGEPAGWVYGEAHRFIRAFADWAAIPVINMECDRFHPCQALADMMTMKERFGGLSGLRLNIAWAYSGSWHKPVAVPQSLLLAAAKCGMDVVVSHPEGFDLDPAVWGAARRFAAQSGASLALTHDFRAGLAQADVVYAKSWCSLQHLPARRGDAVDEAAMTALFEQHRGWCVDPAAMDLARRGALYMHCLPADRGQEVTDEVIDGVRSAVFQQAGNRLHAQNAIMADLMNPAVLR